MSWSGCRRCRSPRWWGPRGRWSSRECTIGLGFIAPGEGGLLIAATTVDSVSRFLILWAVVTVCAGLGDSIGYAIGRRFGPALRETKIIQKYGTEGWDKATGILRKRGAWAVFFARFLPVVRTLTPAAAGTSGLPYRKFLPAVVAGAACWSAMHIALGAALGEAAKRIEGIITTGGAVRHRRPGAGPDRHGLRPQAPQEGEGQGRGPRAARAVPVVEQVPARPQPSRPDDADPEFEPA